METYMMQAARNEDRGKATKPVLRRYRARSKQDLFANRDSLCQN